jgi:4-amino-4-deoxy-L-arabinose transferase-like glycosyltransferase
MKLRGRLSAEAMLAIGLVAAAGVAERVFVYRSSMSVPDSDEAVVGLMARHVLQGQFSTFYWGSWYGGTIESVLTAPIFFVFGTSWLALRMVPIILSAVAALVVWRTGRRLYGEPAASVAGAILWIWPPFLVAHLTQQQSGFYASGLVFGAVLILLALRAVEAPTRLRVGTLGFVAGVALWNDVQLVAIVAPLIVWLCWRQRAVLAQAWLAVPLLLLGASPWIVWNLRHDFGSFSTHITTRSSYPHRVRLFFSPLLPMLLGLRSLYAQEPVLSAAFVDLVLFALLVAFAYGAYRSRRRDTGVLYVIVLAFPFIYSLTRAAIVTDEPRYLLQLSPVLALLLGQAVSVRRHVRAASVVVVAAVLTLSGVTLAKADSWRDVHPRDPAIAPRDIQPVLHMLDDAGIDRVYAQYWVAYRIDFETDERIVAAESKLKSMRFVGGKPIPGAWPEVRWPAYVRTVNASPRAGFVFVVWPQDANRAKRLAVMRQLEAHGYVRHRYGDLVVLLPHS